MQEFPLERWDTIVALVLTSPFLLAKHACPHDGITATAVCPGHVRTPLVERQIADQARAHGLSEDEVLERVILAPHAVKELIEPSDVADAVAFLAGPTGASFTVLAEGHDLALGRGSPIAVISALGARD